MFSCKVVPVSGFFFSNSFQKQQRALLQDYSTRPVPQKIQQWLGVGRSTTFLTSYTFLAFTSAAYSLEGLFRLTGMTALQLKPDSLVIRG